MCIRGGGTEIYKGGQRFIGGGQKFIGGTEMDQYPLSVVSTKLLTIWGFIHGHILFITTVKLVTRILIAQ